MTIREVLWNDKQGERSEMKIQNDGAGGLRGLLIG